MTVQTFLHYAQLLSLQKYFKVEKNRVEINIHEYPLFARRMSCFAHYILSPGLDEEYRALDLGQWSLV